MCGQVDNEWQWTSALTSHISINALMRVLKHRIRNGKWKWQNKIKKSSISQKGFSLTREIETDVWNKLWHSEYLSAGSSPQKKKWTNVSTRSWFCCFLDIPQMCKNMADNNNNNSYMWSDVETIVPRSHPKNITTILDGNSNRMPPCFRSAIKETVKVKQDNFFSLPLSLWCITQLLKLQ